MTTRRRGPRGRMKAPTKRQLAIQVGDPISVLQDDGSSVETTCRTAPWQLGDGTWVLAYTGRSGGYLLTRCTPLGSASGAREARDLIGSVAKSMGGTQRRRGGSGRRR